MSPAWIPMPLSRLAASLWTPASLPSLAAWYEAVDTDATLVKATQTSPTGWSGTNWSGSGLGPYTHTAGSTTALAHASLVIVGNRCQTIFTVSGRTAGSVTFYAGTTAGTARTTNATFTEDLTVAGNTTHSFVPSSDFDGVVTVVAVYNLSRTRWNPRAGSLGGYLEQATATRQPWWGGTAIHFVDDRLASTLTADLAFLHNGTGGTVFEVVTFDSVSGVNVVCGTNSAYAFGVGWLWYNNAGAFSSFVNNGSGSHSFSLTTAGVFSTGQPYIVVHRISTAAVDRRVNGIARGSGTLTAPSAAAPSWPLSVGAECGSGLTYPLVGAHRDLIVCSAYLSDSDVIATERYLATKHGITLP